MMQAQDFPLISHSPKRWAEFVRMRKPILESIVPLNRRGQNDWKAISDETLIAHAIWRMKDYGISGKCELIETDPRLNSVIRKRKLLEKLGLENKKRDWTGMERDEFLAHAKRFVEERGISGKKELRNVDMGLYQALRKRKLLGELGLEERRRNWAKMGRDELVAHAKKIIEERGVSGRKKLVEIDVGLYCALNRRKLLDDIGLSNINVKYRDWMEMGRDGLLAHAKRFVEEREISGKKELENEDSGLYQALRKRNLLGELGLGRKRRNWAGMSGHEMVAFAKEFIGERGISSKDELRMADGGLCLTLWRRKLLDAVFSDAESSKHAEAVAGVIDALDSFGDEK